MTLNRRKAIGVLLGLAVLVLVARGLWLRVRPQSAAASAALPVPARQHPAAANRTSAAASSASLPRLNSDEIEVDFCGTGKVPLDKNDIFAAARFLEATTKKAWDQWLSAMLNSDDYRARATGLLLQGKLGNGELIGRPMAEQSRDELVQLAVGAGDPAVYAMAVYACGTLSAPRSGACGRISLSAWAALDPGNAVPWMSLAAAAATNHDAVAEAQAFAHAAAANRIDSYNWSLLAYAEPEMPKDATSLERSYFSTAFMGVMGAFTPQYSIASKYCTADAMRQPDVHDDCNTLAELMVLKGTNLLDLSIGKSLGARVGWPKQRVDALEQERDALQQASVQSMPQAADQWSCSGVDRMNAYMRRFTSLGELGAAREVLEHSGETVPDMALKWKARLLQMRKDAGADGALEDSAQRQEDFLP